MYQTGTAVEVLGNACIAAIIAQVIKFVYFYIAHKKINFKIFTTTGGMPSSHSAGVIALSMTVGYNEGLNSIPFAIALGYAFVVMYDACGVRRAAGKQAALLNKLVETPGLTGVQVSEKLVEVLGHTPIQVVVGALIGFLVGIIA